jgi:DNA repair exonuclease SbcCD ATPase subunit
MPDSTNDPFLELPEQPHKPSPEELNSQVQRAEAQLLDLKRQHDLLEKQKRELEELSRKQDDLERGRAEMIEKLSRSQVIIERETYESEKRVEQLRSSYTAFSQHLANLERINPKSWSNADLHKELSKALSAVDDARTEYNKSITKINAAGEDVIDPSGATEYETANVDDSHFMVWLKRGLAFTLPLIILGLLALIAFLFGLHG